MSEQGLMLQPGEGRRLSLGASGVVVKASGDNAESGSVFEFTVAPGFDVGAHRHELVEEFFYVADGELELRVGSTQRSCPAGSFMFVPRRTVHQFINKGTEPARLLIFVTPTGHEKYFEGLAAILAKPGPNTKKEIAELRARFDTEEVSALSGD